MRIVDRKTFLSLPAGTVYAKTPNLPTVDFGALEIKGDTVAEVDFYSQCLIGDFEGDQDSGDWLASMDALHAGGSRRPDFDIEGRDGLFDQDQLFAVFDAEDTARLIARLEQALANARPKS